LDEISFAVFPTIELLSLIKEKMKTVENYHLIETGVAIFECELEKLDKQIRFLLGRDSEEAGIKHVLKAYTLSLCVNHEIENVISRIEIKGRSLSNGADELHMCFWGLKKLMEKCSDDLEKFMVETPAKAA
jgi:hypothetical protein